MSNNFRDQSKPLPIFFKPIDCVFCQKGTERKLIFRFFGIVQSTIQQIVKMNKTIHLIPFYFSLKKSFWVPFLFSRIISLYRLFDSLSAHLAITCKCAKSKIPPRSPALSAILFHSSFYASSTVFLTSWSNFS